MILGLAENLSQSPAESFSWLHGLVEATKRAFLIRNEHVFDPTYMTIDPQSVLEAGNLLKIAKGIDMANAMPWPQPANRRP